MRILFINTYDVEGGAAIAAYRLHKALERLYGTENFFLVGHKASSDPNIFHTRRHKSEALKKTKEYIEFITDKVFNKLGLQYRCLPFSGRFILKKAKELNPDVISLHNIHGGYFKTSLLKKLSKIAPIVWTLHDMWAFTANGAHTFGDESWKTLQSGKDEKFIYPSIGFNTGNWLLRQKKKIYAKSHIHPVAPSQWLYDLAKQSPVFEGKDISRIHHGIDTGIFSTRGKEACREALGLKKDARVFMFSSAHDLTHGVWKGGQLLVDILTEINGEARTQKGNGPIDIIVLGRGRLEAIAHLDNLRVHQMGYVKSEQFLSLLLSAADLFIYPTRADSLGLVLIEAIACGTPCITFDIGGCGDVIADGISGYRVPPFDTKLFAQKTMQLLNDNEKLNAVAEKGRKRALELFHVDTMAQKYHEIIKDEIDKWKLKNH
ncbi:MAG: glycosyltransferase [bacterium]|nr:glycosyltransferase [bacterium]